MSYASTIAALCALPVAGVKRALDYQPAQVSTADLPLSFPSLPRGETRVATLSGAMDLPTVRVNLVVVMEATMQGRPEPTWDACIAMIDALTAMLDAATLTVGVVGYNVRVEMLTFSGADGATAYWCVVSETEVM